MSDDHDGRPTTNFARASIVEHPALSEHTIDILQRCLEDHEALLSHVGRTILLLRVLRVDDLVQWTNNTLRIGTENTLNLARDLGLSANNTNASSGGGLSHNSIAPNGPINNLLAIPPPSPSSARHSGATDQSGTPPKPKVPCPQHDCPKTYLSSTMKRFLRQHLVLDHGMSEEQAMVEVSAMAAVSRVEYHQAPTPTISMNEHRYDTGDNKMPVQSHFVTTAGVGQQFGSNRFAVPNPPVVDVHQPHFLMMGGASAHAVGLARCPAQPESGSSQLFGQQLPGTVMDSTTTGPSYTGTGSPFRTGSAQHTMWETEYPGSMEVDYALPDYEHLGNDKFGGDSDAPDGSAAAVNRHIHDHDTPFACGNYE